MKIVLMRHAESEDNANKVLGGNSEAPLTELGIEQAKSAAQKLKSQFEFTKVLFSPRERAKQTALIVVEEMGKKVEVSTSNAITEREFGEFTGKPSKEAPWDLIDSVEKDNEFGVESLGELETRITAFLTTLKHIYSDNDVILVVTHSNPLRIFSKILDKISFEEALKDSYDHAEFRAYDI
jgi:broad specificity phosphatase PhoE